MKLIKLLFCLLLPLLTLQACKTKSKVAQEISKEYKRDSIVIVKEKFVDRNLAINDSIFKVLGDIKTAKPECDSITKEYLENYLRNLETHKTSGDNSYGFKYDELKKMLVFYINLAETKNEKEVDSKLKVSEDNKDNFKTIVVEVIPKYIKVLAWFGVAFILFLLYRFSLIFRR